MKRYDVPRVAFVNKLDRQGANPWKVVDDLRNLLKLNEAAVQIPIGLELGWWISSPSNPTSSTAPKERKLRSNTKSHRN